jgi:hypothetical protein
VIGDGLVLPGHGLPEPPGNATLALHAAELRPDMALPWES